MNARAKLHLLGQPNTLLTGQFVRYPAGGFYHVHTDSGIALQQKHELFRYATVLAARPRHLTIITSPYLSPVVSYR
jgi:predicted 2-oxoglutarate/Fe(II)-dependent dioxygenase YbiX